ncbi:MAG: DivIVA domain-containing protein [Christensenella sp.]|nr:DivIVA domain-containing protein [Christensenella sp.]
MNITPKDILEKEFDKKFSGYDPQQVDSFLDDVIKQFESLMEENENIIAKNEEMKSEIAHLKQKADKLENVEEKLMATVITAQRNATLYIERAEMQAQKIMDTANQNAKTVIESTQLRMEAARQELQKYEKQITDYKKRFRMFLDDQMSYVEAKLDDESLVGHQAAEVSQSINNLTNQMIELDHSSLQDSIHLNEILKQSKDSNATDFSKSTAELQDIVNEIIDH